MSSPRSHIDLPPVDQVGFVVADLDRALETFEPLFGPFRVGQATVAGARYRGREADVTLRLATARSGPLEIELIQPVSGESPHVEFLARGGNGLHHVRFRVTGLDDLVARFEREGHELIWYKRLGDSIAFAYLESPPARGGGVFELYEGP